MAECYFEQKDGIAASVTIEQNGERRVIETSGNGRLDAVSNAIKMYFGISYELATYQEHAISEGSSSKAAAYVEIICQGRHFWGVGVDEDIIKSSIAALVSAANKMAKSENIIEGRDERIMEIMNYIQNNYADVTMDVLAEKFGLSKPYLSKYQGKIRYDIPGCSEGCADEKSEKTVKRVKSDGGVDCSECGI